jgi:hypothetical protein
MDALFGPHRTHRASGFNPPNLHQIRAAIFDTPSISVNIYVHAVFLSETRWAENGGLDRAA